MAKLRTKYYKKVSSTLGPCPHLHTNFRNAFNCAWAKMEAIRDPKANFTVKQYDITDDRESMVFGG